MTLHTLPTTQRAAQIRTCGEPFSLHSEHPVLDVTQLKPNECLVKIEYSGVCQTDVHARNGDWSVKPTLPRIGGHEGVGTIVAIGAGTTDSPVSLGDRVGLKWVARTCLHCEQCRIGNESVCPTHLNHGYTADGTFAEYTVAWTYYVTPIPDALDSATAAPILCAGVAVYKGLKRVGVPIGGWVAIPGAGGGLGHLAIQYATAMGLRVLAIDCGEEKRKMCLALGAEKWIDFRESGDALLADVIAATDGLGPHAALVTAGASWIGYLMNVPFAITDYSVNKAAPYLQACYYVRPAGTVACLGVPSSAPFQVPFEVLVGKEIKVIASLAGSRQDAVEALELAARGKIKCYYSVRGLDEIETVFEEMERGEVTGRVVLKI